MMRRTGRVRSVIAAIAINMEAAARKSAGTVTAMATPSVLQADNVREFWAQRWSGPKLGWHKDNVNPHLLKYMDHYLFEGNSSSNNNEECDDAAAGGNQNIFVPLCGKSVDLVYLSTHPKVSQVVGIDILRTAAEEFAAEHPEVSLEEVPYSSEGELETGVPSNVAEQSTTTCSSNEIATFRGKNLTMLIRNLFDFLPMTRDDRAKYLLLNDDVLLFDTIYDRASLVAISPSLRRDYVRLSGELLRPGGNILLVTFDRRATTTESAKLDGPPFSVDEEEVRRLYETQSWVESVTLLDEVDDLTTDADRERWRERGVVQLFEIVFLIKKKK